MDTKIADRLYNFFSDYLIDQMADNFSAIEGVFTNVDINNEIQNSLERLNRSYKNIVINEYKSISDCCGVIAKHLINGDSVYVNCDEFPQDSSFDNFLSLLRNENEFHDSLVDLYGLSSKKPSNTGHVILVINVGFGDNIHANKYTEFLDDWLDIRKVENI